MSQNVGLLIYYFKEKVLDLGPKSVCAVEMTTYVHWTCTDINRKNVHAPLTSIIGKEMSKEYIF